ncbi:MAG: transporter related protein [Bacteroidetes bacterium]|nr:transporter related protein [Bacteroidota bacterium]
MSEKILRALMRLFAIIAKSDENSSDAREIVQSYLKQQLNKEQVDEYLNVYEDYLKQQNEGAEGEKKKRRLAVSSVKVIVICDQINEELTQKQKFIVLLNLIEFVSSKGSISEQEMEFITTVSSSFNIPDAELNQCIELATKESVSDLEDSSELLIASQAKDHAFIKAKFFHSDSISGELAVLKINSIGIYLIRYFGKTELFLNGQIINRGTIYVLSPGSSIRSSKVLPIYYSDIVSCFLKGTSDEKLVFSVNELEYKFKSGKIGLRKLNFTENSGKLIGIMGGSGAGKSTLLNILNGNNAPSAGEVLINGHNLHKHKKMLEGVVGYIPQDDLLIEELTVYQNLFYNSKLCFDGDEEEKIHQMVLNMLNDLGLIETKDLKVGNPLEQTISGGQRKRLNIALELIREPSVLFVDEPTSGLSSRDSENIMDLLKELALKGKLVFVVIHQPSSDIFKMFDKLLLLDVGGYPIYNGNPVEAVVYFKTLINQVNANESECITCGNVNPEQIFNIIESKVLDENGNQTRNRRISPKEWNEYYTAKIDKGSATDSDKEIHPLKNTFKKPNFLNQFKVFTTRDVLSKLANAQYLYITLFEAPILALVLASLIKYYKSDGEYMFSGNKNIPAYLFMCVLVALFIGLTVSAEEIIRDRKILKRESFLNLSKGSYLTSKIVILFFISAVQTLSFVLIGNYILEIKGMYSDYWMVLFTASCFANMLGLNISASFNSAVTIYILIPFILIPQILLSGVIVKFEELNPKIFEALAVNQFVKNDYEKNIYAYDKAISNNAFKKVYWYSKMNELLDETKNLAPDKGERTSNIALLKCEIEKEMKLFPAISFTSINKFAPSAFDDNTVKETKEYLGILRKIYAENYDVAVKSKDAWMAKFQESETGKAQYEKLLNSSQNTKLEELVKNVGSDLSEVIEENGSLVATTDPIFRDGSRENFVRSHFFAPTKNVFGKSYSTYWVNVFVIWAMTLLLWITLYFDALRKLLKMFENLGGKLRRKKK